MVFYHAFFIKKKSNFFKLIQFFCVYLCIVNTEVQVCYYLLKNIVKPYWLIRTALRKADKVFLFKKNQDYEKNYFIWWVIAWFVNR